MTRDLLKTFEIGVIAEIVHDQMNSTRTTIHESVVYQRFKDMPDWQQVQYKDGVQFVLDHPECTPSEVHNNWHLSRMRGGWIWGHNVRLARQEHPNLIQYEQLPVIQQEKAVAFIQAVKDFQKNAGGFNEANRRKMMEIIGDADVTATDLMPSLKSLMGIIDDLQALCGEFRIPHDQKYVIGIQQAVQALTVTMATADGLRAAKIIHTAACLQDRQVDLPTGQAGTAKETPDGPEKPKTAQAVHTDVAASEVEAQDVEQDQGHPVGTLPGDGGDHRSDADRSEDAGTGTGLLNLTPDQPEQKGESDAKSTDAQ